MHTAGFVIEEGAALTDEQSKRREADAQARALEDGRLARESARTRQLEQLEEAVAETETAYERLIEEKHPFEDMIQEKPSDYTQQHVATGTGLRVVLDAANIGYSTGLPADLSSSATAAAKPPFDVHALQRAIAFFVALGMHVAAFLPAAFVKKRLSAARKADNARMVTEEVEALFEMVCSKTITLVPAGADDDLFILHYARKHCCFIVSNDWYSDHINRHEERMGREMGKSMRHWVDTNRSSYLFVQPGGEFMLSPSSSLALAVSHVQNGAVTVFSGGGGSGSDSDSSTGALGNSGHGHGSEQARRRSSSSSSSSSNENTRGVLIPATLNGLSQMRSAVLQLMSQYRELLRTGMAGDGVAVWQDCEALGRAIDEEAGAAKREISGLMAVMQAMRQG